MNLLATPSIRYRKMDIKNGYERGKSFFEDEKPDFFERNKWYFVVAGIILLSLLAYCFPVKAQTITKVYAKSGLTNYKVRIDGAQPTQLLPTDVFYCGGGFVTQNWSICNTWSTMSVAHGRISCRVGYPTSWTPSLSAANKGIEYAMKVVSYLKLHADEYGIDTNRIYLWGTSAGGFCALGAYQYKVKVAGIINGWGGVLSLVYLTQNNIPVFNISTDYDKTVPIDCGTAFGVYCCGSKSVGEELTRLNVRNQWLVFTGYKHGLLPKDIGYNVRVAKCYDEGLIFFK